ncbi:unnamed protein product [Ceutorhynchus assimilis]|uniref:N-acetyllactosaminide beta-1,3-N-acetylglucosaminyltransferase n=1 Tax=Ceutorhynchus assimilis TaxID=467358 RepID=A0A9N9MHS5_9CUCU|nr:unnamed protein product [Ceutorhynchus assimilis]
MTIGRASKFFKFTIIAFVALIFLLVATRNNISQDDGSNDDIFDQVAQEKKIDKEGTNNNIAALSVTDAPLKEEVTEKTEPPSVKNDELELADYEKMPGAFLKSNLPAPINQTYCNFNYKLPFELNYSNKDLAFPPQEGEESQYRVLYNITEAYWVKKVPQVTYCTHMTANFANFIPELLRRWDGLVTVAAYVPDIDVAFFLEQINQFCYCEPEMHRVSIHIVTHKLIPFSMQNITFKRPGTCAPLDSAKIPIYKDYDESSAYQVNIMRNTARTSALTKYVLVSDIELMPSKNLSKQFLEFVAKYPKPDPKKVFVVPIFEVEKDYPIPDNKEELLKLLADQRAVYFHGLVCAHCQRFPGIEKWLETGYSPQIKGLLEVKRHDPYHRWEPLFIGTNAEPLYSERLSWEGLQDKMTQSLEMCLQNYTYVILDNAFLCHWPGIKREVYKNRFPALVEVNQKFFKEIVADFLRHYPNIKECNADFEYNFENPPRGKKKS